MPVSVMYLNLNALKHSGLIFRPTAAHFHCINLNLLKESECEMEFPGMERSTPQKYGYFCGKQHPNFLVYMIQSFGIVDNSYW